VASVTVAASAVTPPRRLDLLADLGIDANVPLYWPTQAELERRHPQWLTVEGVRVFARATGTAIVRTDHGIRFPFDPDEAARNLRSEAYVRDGWRALARRAYYGVRPLLPRAAQLAARRAFTRVQSRSSFPGWPLETALHDLIDLVGVLAEEAAGEPLLRRPTWPDGRTWALVLTHDVETAEGLAGIEHIRRLEERFGLRSCWNFVPERYDVDDALVADLAAGGHEIGVHGLRHDGRDLASERMLRRRLPAMREAAERWGAVGFRAPATQRRWSLMPKLGFEYDSSYPDTDPYEPQAGGCCSWLPFFNQQLVELPITVPQDHTLFEVLGHDDEWIWTKKIDALRLRGGMALVLTHPDYLREGGKALAAYERVLARYASDRGVWHALPREVASWWRQRASS
jgi:peptidoglycan/xylan/chitin deacetylase (PgdA/CDA1 family)